MSSVGSMGELMALSYLQKKGYSLIEKNYRTRYGEIDLIVKKQDTLIFVEVKTRKTTIKGEPYEAITYRKRKHMIKVAKYFLALYKPTKVRLDAVSIILDREGRNSIKHFENIPIDDLV